jgi:hypothetical protein
MTTWQVALLLKPLAYIIVFGFIAIGLRVAVMHYMRDGWLKKLLLFELYPDDWN